jgi:hypothetical protein
MNFDPLPQKKFIFLIFFQKILFIRLRIYIQQDFVIIFVCVDKITWKTKIQSSVPFDKLNECTLNGMILIL